MITGPTSGVRVRGGDRRRSAWRTVAFVLAGLAAAVVTTGGQSLADLAKAEEARRKSVAKPARVYTNSSLKKIPGDVIPTPASPRPATTDGAGDTADPQPPPEADVATTPTDAEAADEPANAAERWRRRITDARSERDNNALMVDALQSRVNGLLADFTARDDPAQRAQIAAERQKALDELARRQKLHIALDKAIADIEEEARRAGVPPGWLR